MIRIILLGIGAAAGFAVGYQMRPAIWGVKVPLGVVTSNHPMDSQLRQEMIAHLSISTATGAAIALAFVIILALVQRGKTDDAQP